MSYHSQAAPGIMSVPIKQEFDYSQVSFSSQAPTVRNEWEALDQSSKSFDSTSNSSTSSTSPITPSPRHTTFYYTSSVSPFSLNSYAKTPTTLDTSPHLVETATTMADQWSNPGAYSGVGQEIFQSAHPSEDMMHLMHIAATSAPSALRHTFPRSFGGSQRCFVNTGAWCEELNAQHLSFDNISVSNMPHLHGRVYPTQSYTPTSSSIVPSQTLRDIDTYNNHIDFMGNTLHTLEEPASQQPESHGGGFDDELESVSGVSEALSPSDATSRMTLSKESYGSDSEAKLGRSIVKIEGSPKSVDITARGNWPSFAKASRVCGMTMPNGTTCKASFQKQEHLKRHQDVHTSNEHYHCPDPDCKHKNKKFTARPDNFREHLKTHLVICPRKRSTQRSYDEMIGMIRVHSWPDEQKKIFIKFVERCREEKVHLRKSLAPGDGTKAKRKIKKERMR